MSQVTTRVGGFEMKSSTILVSDPSYKKSYAGKGKVVFGNLSKIVSRVKQGKWSGYVLKNKEKQSRVWSLIAMSDDVKSLDLKKWISIGDVAVDSGMMGIFDMKYYPEEPRDADFYDKVCQDIDHKHQAIIYEKFGVISMTGYGDGSYPANKCLLDGKVVAVQVDF